MKTLYESLLNNTNGSIEQENIITFCNTKFNPLISHRYHIDKDDFKYNVGKDSKGWYVDIESKNSNKIPINGDLDFKSFEKELLKLSNSLKIVYMFSITLY